MVEEVRKALTADPYAVIDILNTEKPPVAKGQCLLAKVWWAYGWYRWVASQHGKVMQWSGNVAPDGTPAAGPFTQKEMERTIVDIKRELLKPNTPLRSPIHSSTPAASVDRHIPFPPAPDAVPATFAEVQFRAIDLADDIPLEKVQEAVSFLNTQLSSIPSVSMLPPLLTRAYDGTQLSSILSSFTWPTGPEVPKLKLALFGWVQYVEKKPGCCVLLPACKRNTFENCWTCFQLR